MKINISLHSESAMFNNCVAIQINERTRFILLCTAANGFGRTGSAASDTKKKNKKKKTNKQTVRWSTVSKGHIHEAQLYRGTERRIDSEKKVHV